MTKVIALKFACWSNTSLETAASCVQFSIILQANTVAGRINILTVDSNFSERDRGLNHRCTVIFK